MIEKPVNGGLVVELNRPIVTLPVRLAEKQRDERQRNEAGEPLNRITLRKRPAGPPARDKHYQTRKGTAHGDGDGRARDGIFLGANTRPKEVEQLGLSDCPRVTLDLHEAVVCDQGVAVGFFRALFDAFAHPKHDRESCEKIIHGLPPHQGLQPSVGRPQALLRC